MSRVRRHTSLPPPYLKRVWLDDEAVPDRAAYPFCLPLFRDPAFELVFDRPVTIIVGENGTGKSTLLEGIAVLAGFDEGGGGPGYRAVDHSGAIERGGGELAAALKAAWLPKVGQAGSSAPKASSRWLATLTKLVHPAPISCPIRTAKASCA